MKTVYVEQAIRQHPRVLHILERLGSTVKVIECDHYREIFNRKYQDFRLQKSDPALILASKPANRVSPTPPGFGIGGANNYYFSLMLNCPFDCRYCFLQGMYRSAHYVVFVNYEDYMNDITQTIHRHPDEPVYFFSGYDADSLAYDPVTRFTSEFLPFFAKHPQAIMELRTKSVAIKPLLKIPAINNVVVAFSFTPEAISRSVEHKVPSVEKRIKAIDQLVKHGWNIGLRFDPLIYCVDFQEQYDALFHQLFSVIPQSSIHSISVGVMRFPEAMFRKIKQLYPKDRLLAHPLEKRDGLYSYNTEIETDMTAFVMHHVKHYAPTSPVFQCTAE